MKKVISVGLGGYSFQMEEDAYLMLQDYLAHFKAKLGAQDDVNEVMQDIECRLAEILLEDVKMPNQVVGVGLVQIVIKRVGMPDGSNDYTDYQTTYQQAYQQPQRKLYRDPDHHFVSQNMPLHIFGCYPNCPEFYIRRFSPAAPQQYDSFPNKLKSARRYDSGDS